MTREAAIASRPSEPVLPMSSRPVIALADAIAQEREILRRVQAVEPPVGDEPPEVSEQSWQLPQGTFKTTTKRVAAGQPRQQRQPFNPNAK